MTLNVAIYGHHHGVAHPSFSSGGIQYGLSSVPEPASNALDTSMQITSNFGLMYTFFMLFLYSRFIGLKFCHNRIVQSLSIIVSCSRSRKSGGVVVRKSVIRATLFPIAPSLNLCHLAISSSKLGDLGIKHWSFNSAAIIGTLRLLWMLM